MTVSEPPAGAAPESAPALSPIQRIGAIYASPSRAWGGLESRAQWWIPFLIILGLSALFAFALHDRALIPMVTEGFDRQVADGEMGAQQAEAAEQFMSGPLGRELIIVQQTVVLTGATMLQALVITFTVGFLLGGKLRFRLGLEVACWSGLVGLPGQFLFFVLAWFRETMEGIHVGLGAFVPEPDTPSRLLRGLATFLDFLGPFSIWGLVVMIFGAAALTGLPRRRVAWALSSVQVVLWLFFAALAGLFARGA